MKLLLEGWLTSGGRLRVGRLGQGQGEEGYDREDLDEYASAVAGHRPAPAHVTALGERRSF
jgi:hypothetical protein